MMNETKTIFSVNPATAILSFGGWNKRRLLGWLTAFALFSSAILLLPTFARAADHTFTTEYVDKGASAGQANRNAEDASYQTITETDEQSNTNYSGSSENVVIGTTGGGSFPSALDTDDATRRNYIEANTGGGSPTYQVLRPTSDGDVTTMVEYPTTPTTHWDKVDETTTGGDNDATYLEGVTNAQESELGMSNPSDPGGSPNIDVTMWQISKGETTSSCTVVWGIEIGGVEYQGGSTAMTSITYANFSYEWTTNPAGGEWTLTAINGLETYVRVTDANPDTHTTQIGLLIEFNPTAAYQLDAQITYSSVTSGTHTISYMVYCQGYKNGDTEGIKVQAWDYNLLQWNDKTTISAGSDTDYDFALTTDERSSGSNEVKLRLLDASNGDATQTTVYLDILKVNRIDTYHTASVRMDTSATVPSDPLDFKVKGYTSDAESWNAELWNYSSSGWDVEFTMTALSNTWHSSPIVNVHQLSGGIVKCRFDNQGSPDQTTASVLYLDYVYVLSSPSNAAPELSEMGSNSPKYIAETAEFWAIYTDEDNDPPEYMRVVIDSNPLAMTKNNSGDTDYTDGCAYYYTTTSLTHGDHPYYFATKDATHSEVTGGSSTFTIGNRAPTITNKFVDDHEWRNTYWEYDYAYEELDGDSVVFEMTTNGTFLNINSASGLVYGTTSDPVAWYSTTVWCNDSYGGSDSDSFILYVDNREPTITNGPGSHIDQWQNVAWYYDFDATDPDTDVISWGRAGESWLSIDSDGNLSGTTPHVPGTYPFTVYANDSYGGQDTYAFDLHVNNRDPVITSSANTTQLTGTYLQYHILYSDPDGDTVGLEFQTESPDIILAGDYIQGSCVTPGIYHNKLWANDTHGASDLQEWDLEVGNDAPYITTVPTTTGTNNTAYTYDADAVDNETQGSLVWDIETNCTDLDIDPNSGLVSGTPTSLGWFYVNVTVSDGLNEDYQNYTLTIEEDPPPETGEFRLSIGVVMLGALLAIAFMIAIKGGF